ncbi:hypothetical protein M514_00977 [Trichuris suis]|uniref:Uncharacterized protein n=1 Tax=Trichuris suis TaxID=68888 RepID=A0A085MLW8_9BILA|nr:hypothetical protein M513_00977 [Trichuris suis]KFD70478.1 hypothetical protein M514_00977 [Trichuris suis]
MSERNREKFVYQGQMYTSDKVNWAATNTMCTSAGLHTPMDTRDVVKIMNDHDSNGGTQCLIYAELKPPRRRRR